MSLRIIVILAVLISTPILGQQRMNMSLLKQDTRIFEGIVGNVLNQKFTHPYALESEPMATYVQGYGIVVTFHLNINRATIRLPFGDVIQSRAVVEEAEKRSRDEQIETLQEAMSECLAAYASAIKQLSGHDRVTVNAHVEDRSERDPKRKKTILVLSSLKDDIDLLAMRKITPEEFRSRLSKVRY